MTESEILQRYNEKNIFITGATGFVGVALLEKLLRCIPNIGDIYILVRPLDGNDVKIRVKNLLNEKIFRRLKKEKGNAPFQKIIAIQGDLKESNLGMTAEAQQLLAEKVDIVFHSAACLHFGCLKSAVEINLAGTRNVVEFCKKTGVQALVHVSTAYVNSHKNTAQEEIYEIPCDPDNVIEDCLTEDNLNKSAGTFLRGYTNVYTFTKAIAEHEITRQDLTFPRAIIRPSVILGTWKDPIPGWSRSKFGLQGFLFGVATGILRRVPLNEKLIYDYVPVDIVVNAIIVSAHFILKEKENGKDTSKPTVLHCTTSASNPFKWVDLKHKLPRMLHMYPLKGAYWYPTLKFLPYFFLFRISAFIFHMIPAIIVDLFLKITGRRTVLVRLQRRINKSFTLLEPFIVKEWNFTNSRCMLVHQSLNNSDKEMFGLDTNHLVWGKYFYYLIVGARFFLNNEDLKTLPAARKKDSFLWVLNNIAVFRDCFSLVSNLHIILLAR